MACMKLGSKTDLFRRQGQTWFCTTGLPSDIVVEVGDMFFHLHKFPLLSRSGVMEKRISEASEMGEDEETSMINLPDVPGGAKTFELVAKFCYGVKIELTASNIVYIRCAAERLEMTEDYGDGNLISLTEVFLNQVVLKSWKDSLKAVQTCDDDVLDYAEKLQITKRCIESLAVKASSDPNLFGWPVVEQGGPMQSPGGTGIVMWNGISTGGARARATTHPTSDWWFEDASTLSLSVYKKLVSAMENRGIKQEIIAGSLTCYARKHLPGLNRRHNINTSNHHLSEEDQKLLLEEVVSLLPMQKGLVTTKFLCGLLRTAKLLGSSSCISNLETLIGMQLDQASLEDLLMPTFTNSMETLYDVDCVQRSLNQFLAVDQVVVGDGGGSPYSVDGQLTESPSLTPITMVAKLIDGFLAEVAPDINLKMPKFMALAAAVPEYARPLDDGLYRAIDIYLKAHSWMVDSDREQLCQLMDCQKLSLEACTHAAQNERLPLRTIVQVLFFEQIQLRTSIAGCFLVSENLDGSRQLRSGGHLGSNEGGGGGGGFATAVRENQVLKVGMDNMRTRVSELEKECSNMREEMEKLGRSKSSNSTWGNVVSKKLGFKMKSQICSAQVDSVSNQRNGNGSLKEGKHVKKKQQQQHKKELSFEE